MSFQRVRALVPVRHDGIVRIPGATSGENGQDFVVRTEQATRLIAQGLVSYLADAEAPATGLEQVLVGADGLLRRPGGLVVGGGVNFQPGAAMLNICDTPSVLTGYAGSTLGFAIPVPFEFTGVQFLIPHLGGSGAMTGVKMLVATSDDIGPGDYSLAGTSAENDALLRKFITPSIAGSETNALSANGGEAGWLRVTKSGAAGLFDLQDAGAGNWDTELTDRMNLRGVQDVTYAGHYNLLIRHHAPSVAQGGTGVITRNSYVGTNTNQFKTDAGGVPPFLFASRTGDNVTNPTTWTRALTPNFPTSPLIPLGIILYGSQRYSGVLFSMDSRGAVSTETAGTFQYRSLPFYFETQAKNTRFTVIRSSWSGGTEAQYSAMAMALMESGRNTVRHVVHLIDSVNDGAVTQAMIDANKATALAVKAKAESINAEVTFVVSFPRLGGIPADQLVLLDELETWAKTQTRRVFNPLKTYGNASGGWRTGVGFDSNHMLNTAYADMASRLYDLLES